MHVHCKVLWHLGPQKKNFYKSSGLYMPTCGKL